MKDDLKFVVIGGAGFIGFHLASYLAKQGSNVHIVDDFSNSDSDIDLERLKARKNVDFSHLDASSSAFRNLIDSNSIVLNLAAINGTQNFYDKPLTVVQKSSLVGINVAESCALKKVKRYYYFGSSESYAGGLSLGLIQTPTSEQVPLVLEDPSNPRWSYAAAKTIGEVAFFSARKQYGLQGGIFRLHNVYGPRMGFKHVIPDLMKNFGKGNFTVLNCDHTRTFLYSSDLVQIIYKVMQSNFHEDIYPVMNIGSNKETQIRELARIICASMQIDTDILCVQGHPGSVSRRVPDITKMLNYVQQEFTPLEVGIRETCDYYMKIDS